MGIQDKIDKLIPYINENFITYPLQEEGKYIPFIGFWQRAKTKKELASLNKNLKWLDNKTGYSINIIEKTHVSVIHDMVIYPSYRDLKNGSYKFTKKDWSIEEMLDILDLFIQKNNIKKYVEPDE
jgi:hypothetical protein